MNAQDTFPAPQPRQSDGSSTYQGQSQKHENPPVSPYNYGRKPYPTHYPPYSSRYNSPRPLHSVVTTSFSIEEREDNGDSRGRFNGHAYEDRDSGSMTYPSSPKVHMNPSDGYGSLYHQVQYAHQVSPAPLPQKANSFAAPEPMKRNFYHHAQPADAYTSSISPDFSPPKRSKVNGSNYAPRVTNVRAASWDVGSPYAHQLPHQYPRGNILPGSWDRSEHLYQGGSDLKERSPGSWNAYNPSAHHSLQEPGIHPGKHDQGRDDQDEHRGGNDLEKAESVNESLRQQFEPPRNATEPMHESGMHLVVRAAAAVAEEGEVSIGLKERLLDPQKDGEMVLLSMPEDQSSLSETLCIVRENIEVFTATKSDVDAPAPGRKHAVSIGQVGLRCIYCRHTTKSSDRVKRAVCYPSSIKRIYRTVIDMKLDHFTRCRFVPKELKNRLEALKTVQTRSTGTTMQYFIKAAHKLGMVDANTGVRLCEESTQFAHKKVPTITDLTLPLKKPEELSRNDSMISASSGSAMSISSSNSLPPGFDVNANFDPTIYFEGCIALAVSDDKTSLSSLRCFLRENVCAFTASEEDIAFRAPTTFSISSGQVGIGCMHCVKLPPQQRSNRAVCFPTSISRIYQSVADIQRFHMNECQNLPDEVREKFQILQNASSKGSKGLATRQYWITSARKLGLVDTCRGIRFGRDPSQPSSAQSLSLDILAQVAVSVTTASKQLVVPEDKGTIAGFLYLAMEQLQPCRFTEADRNKRRLKSVGCIGVECKHCVGQVDSRKFFWSSVSAVESNFVSVHTHMLECKMIPKEIKDELARLKLLRKEETSNLPSGSQKAFFAHVWERLHADDASKDEGEIQPRDAKHEDQHAAMAVDSRDDVSSSDNSEVPTTSTVAV